ncbi:MAG: arsenic resistance protein [Casimicrobiaceae bacterium]|nr:arsenic resistance protein [Casimicrobiaceae bacterium]
MIQAALERYQLPIYLVAIGAGLGLGSVRPTLREPFEALLWPALALLLFATFLQIPLLHLREAFADRRFLSANLIGNFLLVPAVLALVLPLLPEDPAVRLGVVLVLVVPCTDWFITFTALGRGDAARALAVTPVNLVLQLLLLPVYLWLLVPTADLARAFAWTEVLPAALALIAVPLAAAGLAERWIEAPGAPSTRARWRAWAALWPVPLLALVVFLIAGAQVGTVRGQTITLLAVVPVFVGYLALALVLARCLARFGGLAPPAGRTLAFSLGTRNSFVVLPLALALPPGWEGTAVVIVVQSLVELGGMVVFLAVVPRLFRS